MLKTLKFKREISYGSFDNALESAIDATKLFDKMQEHFEKPNLKKPMLLFIGYDGCLTNAVAITKENPTSAIGKILKEGAIYIGRTGGERIGDQQTDTAPGWASIFTGAWGRENGVINNSDVLSEKTKSIMCKLLLKGTSASFVFSWACHKEITYNREAKNYPNRYLKAEDDEQTLELMRSRLKAGDCAIFGIFEHCDHEGHKSGFSINNKEYMNALNTSETYANIIIEDVIARKTYKEEDWLILIATDHGGVRKKHGGRTKMETTIFFASNKKVFKFDDTSGVFI
ncbi:MAG: hypothetical protein LBF12_06365 [Christensenellaceae bacterium]|jgi:hypothetical protein|nr:hypothetical protein [Christensenellaceae bacterium]